MTDDELKAEFAAMRAHVSAECEKVETKLLTAFHGWARTMEIRVRHSSKSVEDFEERFALLEDRVSELERKRQ